MYLRPERAMLDALLWTEAGYHLRGLEAGPTLEYAANDGLVTFAALGGKLTEAFDTYFDADFMRPDVFDSVYHNTPHPVLSRAPKSITLGLCAKQSHLVLASRYHAYQELLMMNTRGAVQSDHFRLVWAPSLFLESQSSAHEVVDFLSRITCASSRIVTMLPTRRQAAAAQRVSSSSQLSGLRPMAGPFVHHLAAHNPSMDNWLQLFQRFGFKVVSESGAIDDHQFFFYTYGLRALFPSLLRALGELRRGNSELADAFQVQFRNQMLQAVSPLIDAPSPDLNESHWRLFSLTKASG